MERLDCDKDHNIEGGYKNNESSVNIERLHTKKVYMNVALTIELSNSHYNPIIRWVLLWKKVRKENYRRLI